MDATTATTTHTEAPPNGVGFNVFTVAPALTFSQKYALAAVSGWLEFDVVNNQRNAVGAVRLLRMLANAFPDHDGLSDVLASVDPEGLTR